MLQKLHLQNRFLHQPMLIQLGFVLLFNTAIAVLLALVIKGAYFWHTWLVSQSIGLTIFFSFCLFSHFADPRGWRIAIPLTIGSVCGVMFAMVVMVLLNGKPLNTINNLLVNNTKEVLINLFLAFFFGIIILYFFLSRERHFQASQALKEYQIRNLDHKKQVAETQLQLLQAQIEPHFLFNSLSNVISLVENDPPRAKRMLESLARYLRASLSRSHDRNGTLRDELDLIENYLKVIQIRMGNRLRYTIDVPQGLAGRPFPIMLMQPLVENAIQHGLEPLPEGGWITIEARQQNGRLHISVRDNGAGLKDGDLTGYGLNNVRQRLQSLFGEAGKLRLEKNPPQGVRASIEVPYA